MATTLLLRRIKDWAASIATFRTGDVIPVDGPSGTAKMAAVDLVNDVVKRTLAGNAVQAFDPAKPDDEGGYAYYAGQKVVNDGKTWLFILDKPSGAWDAAYAVVTDMEKLLEQKRHFSSEDFYLGYYIGGAAGNKVTKTPHGSTHAGNGFVIIPVSAGETIRLKSSVDTSAGSNFIVTDSDFVVLYNSGLDQTPNKEFTYNVSADGYVICNSLPSNFSFSGLFDEEEIRSRMSESFEPKVSFDGSDLEMGWAFRSDPVTKVQLSASYAGNGCLKIPVKAGEQLTIKGSPSTSDSALILTDASSGVIKRYAAGTLDALTSVPVEADGFACINSLQGAFACHRLTTLERTSIGNIGSTVKYAYSDLTAGKAFAAGNIGFAAPAMSDSSYNRALAVKVSAGDLLTVTSRIQGAANLLYLTDRDNVIRAAYTKEMAAAKIRVRHDGEALVSCENGLGTFSLVHTKGAPVPFSTEKPLARNQPPADGSSGAIFDAESMTTQDVYDALDALCAKYPYLLTSRTLGKDESRSYDVREYVFAQRTFLAWERENHPKMYAFKHGSTIVYSDRPSPMVGDSLYSTEYIGTAAATVSSVGPGSWTLSDSNEYGRYAPADVEPTLIYTMVGGGLRVYYSNGYDRNASATQSGNDIVYDGNTYHRNHVYDTKRGEDYAYKICIGCAEHTPTVDPRDTAVTLYNLVHDLCENAAESEFLTRVRNSTLIAFIPVINPWGFDRSGGGRNFNGVDINRNYNTPGWARTVAGAGTYPGSAAETQYAMGLFAKRKWDGALSIHCLGNSYNGRVKMTGAESIDPAQDIANVLDFYGVSLTTALGDDPETVCSSNAYQRLAGTTGVTIELNRGDDDGAKHTAVIETMNCTYLMLALWYLIYLRD